MLNVLLTGATGFLGWELLRQLRGRGDWRIRVLARAATLANSARGRALAALPDIDIVTGDLADRDRIRAAVEDIDIVYHLAWKAARGRETRGSQPDASADDTAAFNIDTTGFLLDAIEEQVVSRLVYTSTVAVYGPSSDMSKWPVNEETPLEGSHGGDYSRNYIEPKRKIEESIRERSLIAGFEYVILRLSIIYGIGAPMAEGMIQRALRGPAPGNHAQQVGLQMVHVGDVARALIVAAEHPYADGREFNIAGDEVATPEDMSAMLRAAAFRIRRGFALPGRYVSRFAGYRRYDTTKAELVLDFRPRVSLAEGLAELMASALGVDYRATGFDPGTARVARAYDRRTDFNLLAPVYENSDFLNFGYWAPGITSLKAACEHQLDKLLALLPEKTGRLLDVACGKGATTRHLLKYFPAQAIAAIDISRKRLEVARNNAPGVTFLLMDAARLEFPDASFEHIVCVEAASHFNTRDAFLKEAFRVLKPGGRLVLSDAIFTPRADDPRVRARQEANYVASVDEYIAALRRAGFERIEMTDVTPQCWGGFSSHIKHFLEHGRAGGTLDPQPRQAISRWFGRIETYIERYVLGGCAKPLPRAPENPPT